MIDQRIIDQFNKRAPFQITEDNILVLSHVGSHSHGTYIPPVDPMAVDDIDYMGIIIPPVEYVLGIKSWEGLNFMFEELDCVFYSFQKFIRLLTQANPNVIGMLWMRPQEYHAQRQEWQSILDQKALFSTLKSYNSFSGYAHEQLRKMTSFDAHTTAEWDRANEIFEAIGWTMADVISQNVSLPMPDLQKLYDYCATQDELRFHPSDDELTAIIADTRKVAINIHAKHFQGYMGAKRKALVRKYGYDTKNGAHLIRLLRMALEFLQTGKFNVYRQNDAEELKEIKQGKWPLEKVKADAEMLFDKAKAARDVSTLPADFDHEKVNNLVVELQRKFYNV
jgi:predicted nucleotidyltransferase